MKFWIKTKNNEEIAEVIKSFGEYYKFSKNITEGTYISDVINVREFLEYPNSFDLFAGLSCDPIYKDKIHPRTYATYKYNKTLNYLHDNDNLEMVFGLTTFNDVTVGDVFPLCVKFGNHENYIKEFVVYHIKNNK